MKGLVLSGGGISGVAILGTLSILDISEVTHISGTSVGALIGACIAMGYTPRELFNVMLNCDPKSLKRIAVASLGRSFGLDTWGGADEHIVKLLEDKGIDKDVTLSQFFNTSKMHLTLTATDVTDRKTVHLSHVNHPDLMLRVALQMTCAVPVIFAAPRYQGHVWCDGGLLNNFPLDAIDLPTDDVLGIGLVFDEDEKTAEGGFDQYLYNLIECMRTEIIRLRRDATTRPKVIDVRVKWTWATFEMAPSDILDLYTLGSDAASAYLKKS